MDTVNFFFRGVRPTLNHRSKLKVYIKQIFRKEKKKLAGLSYIFCTDEFLLGINQQFLKHNYYTDIITFNLGGAPEDISGEIYISVDRVKENAKIFKLSFQEELHRVIFHGVLHLCGYKDKSREESNTMRQKENYYIEAYLG
jgi:probable rRNA maturation factor